MNAVLLNEASQSKISSSKRSVEVRFSRYDQVSSLVTTLVALLSAVSMILFAIWLTTVIRVSPSPTPIKWNESPSGGAEGAIALDHELEEPSEDELAETPTPNLATALQQIGYVAPAIAANVEGFESIALQDAVGIQDGDRRDAGPAGGVQNPPWERWEIRYSLASREEYGAQLDSFDIELGAIHRDSPEILYLKSIGADVRDSREGTKTEEKRIYFAYQKGKLRDWDQEFFRQLDIDPSKYILVHFYPEETKERLIELEMDALEGRELSEVKRTVFGVQKEDDVYKFYVIDVRFE